MQILDRPAAWVQEGHLVSLSFALNIWKMMVMTAAVMVMTVVTLREAAGWNQPTLEKI